jgi:hypothetical protein
MMIGRTWASHRGRAIAVAAVSLVAIVAAGLLIARPGESARFTSTPSATVAETLLASPSDSPTSQPSPSAFVSSAPTPLPSGMAYSDLDGVLTTQDLAHRLPLAIMVDDNTAARPQSGFTSASIVYQAQADGGEDRYMMVFQEGTASAIGPVRSARPYYVYWAAESKALFGHYGGDAVSLQQVIPSNVNNIYNEDALNGGACPYHRVATRAAPHNAYTYSSVLITCAARRQFPAIYQNLPVRLFRADSPMSQRPASQSISVPYPTGAIGYTFEPATDSYLRLVRGKLQIDAANNKQVTARNVVVLFQALSYDSFSDPGHKRPVIANVGTGRAVIFVEGRAVVGTWKKPSNTALTRLYDSTGAEIPLVRGEIFIQSIPVGAALSYK